MKPPKLVRITTVPLSMRLLLEGQPAYMRSRGIEVVLVSSDGPDWDGIKDISTYAVHKIGMERAIAPLKDIRALWLLIRLFGSIRPDIVHSHTPKAGLLSMVAARVAGVPVRLHTVAGLPLMESRGLKRKVLVWAEKITYRCATGVYPNSHRLKTYIEVNGFTRPSKLKVIGGGSSNGIDTEHFKPTAELVEQGKTLRKQWGIPDQDLIFVFIGRVVRDKGVDELVGAFTRLSGRRTGIWLVLVGGFEDDLDPIGEQTRRRIREHPRIRSAGFVTDVRPYLSACDILVFPSYREGFPNVPLQAGCFGLPSIVTDINGCNEIILPGLNGEVVPVKDLEALEGAMERLAADEGMRNRFAAAARSNIVEKYKREYIWEALYGEYQHLLKHLT